MVYKIKKSLICIFNQCKIKYQDGFTKNVQKSGNFTIRENMVEHCPVFKKLQKMIKKLKNVERRILKNGEKVKKPKMFKKSKHGGIVPKL